MIISCVVLNYNDSATTSGLVASMHDYALIDHVIVVDNLSTDDSYNRLKELEDEKVIVIQTEKNGGYGFGNNFGLRYAKEELNSDYVLICNPDVMFEERIILSALEIMEQNSKVAVVSPVQLNAKGDKANTLAWRIPSGLRYIACSGLILKRIIRSYKYEADELHDGVNFVDCVPGSLLFVNAEAFVNVGGYDESIFLYCEETVLGKRLHDAGYLTVLDGSQTYLHLHSVSINKSISSEVKRTKLMLKSRRFVIKKYLGGKRLQLALADFAFGIVLFETRLKVILRHQFQIHKG